MSPYGRVRSPQVLLVLVPCIAGEVGSGTDVGPPLDGGGTVSSTGPLGPYGGDPAGRRLHDAGVGVGGEEVGGVGGRWLVVVAGGKAEVPW